MRILSRYILSEVLSHALIGGVLFTFILFIRDLGHILEIVVRNSAPLSSVFEVFLFTLPNTFTVTIPMAVLVGILLGLSRLAADSEITAMRASGVGEWKFVGIVSVIAIGGWLIGLGNSLYVAPKAAQALLQLDDRLRNSQASYEIQPRVFYEDFKNFVLYVEDVRAGSGAANWRRIFMVDLTDPSNLKVTTAESATVVNSSDQELEMRLRNGTEHETQTNDADVYKVSTFASSDLPLQLASQATGHLGRMDTPIHAMSNSELLARGNAKEGRRYLIEFNQRLAYPAACLVLMLIGVPLGLSSRRGGKSQGFVVTIILVFLYYFLSSAFVALGKDQKIPPFVAVWAANLLFSIAGLVLLRQMSRGGKLLSAITSINFRLRLPRFKMQPGNNPLAGIRWRDRRSHQRGGFPLILDDYILSEFLRTFFMVLFSFVLLMLVFTFFELLGDILHNHIALSTIGNYLLNLTPSMIYSITPLSVLIAVLVSFGVLQRNSELTAIKATGISLYRLVLPVLVISAVIAATLFVFDELYLPQANRRQEALRNVIKGHPAQTFLRPDQKWIFGKQLPGKAGHIYYYQFFDPDQDRFANLTIFEFNPETLNLERRIFANSAHWEQQSQRWVFDNGWVRDFAGDSISSYEKFDVKTFPELPEFPNYFKKENRQSQEMSFVELDRYIRDLRQSGLDTMRLRVQLQHKIAYPVVTLIMAILAVPFALIMGRRGSLAGVGIAIGVAISYWVMAGMFEAMGNVNLLPAVLAAWSPDLLFALTGGYLLLRTPT